MTSKVTTRSHSEHSDSLESWLVSAGRDRHPGSPLNLPLTPASNFVLGESRAYSSDDGTRGWEPLEGIVSGMEGGSSVSFASGMAAIAAIFDQLAAGSVVALPDECYQGVVGLANAGQNRGRWTNAVLTKENTQWLAKLRRGPVWPIRRKVQCVHGPPKDEDEYTFFREDAWAAMNTSRARIVFCGHTHWQTGWSFHGRELTPLKPEYQSSDGAEQFEVPLHKGYRYLFNPGSVGQPRGGDWRAAFAIYDEGRSLLTWHRAPYKVHIAERRIHQAKLPEVLATRLRNGR